MPQAPGEKPSSSNRAQERVNEFLRQRGLEPDDPAPVKPADPDAAPSNDADTAADTEGDQQAASRSGPPDSRSSVPGPGETDWAAAPEAGDDA
jgi:hypothetical protein